MKGAEDDLVYKRPEIDNGVVNFVTKFFANLQSFNQIWFLVSTARRNLKNLLSVHHVRKGFEALDSNA